MNNDKWDLTGKRFGRLVAIKKVGKADPHGTLWLCQCDCGNFIETRAGYLRAGQTTSCGCYRTELRSAIMSRSAEWNTKHGHCRRGKRSKLYNVWNTMRERCDNPNSISYPNYGAKGITVCDEWKKYENFLKFAVESGYKEGLALDRVDSDGPYCPENCRWVTQRENNRNKKNLIYLTARGETHLLVDWARMTGQPKARLYDRRKYGWSDEEIIFGKNSD